MKKPSVLIIDDDSIFSTVIETLIAPYAETVQCSANAENGMHFVSKEKPGFIFLDNQLPRLNGLEVIELYREISPDTQIILMSGSFKIDEVAEAIEQKVDHVVAKKQLSEEKVMSILHTVRSPKKEKKPNRHFILPFGKKRKESNQKKNIAIVDDDELFSFGLNWTLNKMKRLDSKDQYEVYQNAKSFYASFQEARPDIVFLDYFLEETTAKSVLEHLKESAPDAKVIIVSSQDDPQIALELAEMNVYGYIIKSEDWKARLAEYAQELAI